MPDHIPACAYLVHAGNVFPQAFSVVDKQRAEDIRLRRNDNSMVTPLVPRHALQLLADALQALAAGHNDVVDIADVIARAHRECAVAAMSQEAQAYAQAIKREQR